jgi:hypothetical protein
MNYKFDGEGIALACIFFLILLGIGILTTNAYDNDRIENERRASRQATIVKMVSKNYTVMQIRCAVFGDYCAASLAEQLALKEGLIE